MNDSIVSQANITDTITLIDEITSLVITVDKPQILFVDETTSLVINNDNSTVITSSTQGPPGVSSELILTFSSDATISQQTLDTFSSTTYGGTKYIIYATVGSTRQVCEILLLHDGINVNIVEYANIVTSVPLCTFSGDILNGFVRLLITPMSISTNFKIIRSLLPA
jgi:hypothetical protein